MQAAVGWGADRTPRIPAALRAARHLAMRQSWWHKTPQAVWWSLSVPAYHTDTGAWLRRHPCTWPAAASHTPGARAGRAVGRQSRSAMTSQDAVEQTCLVSVKALKQRNRI